MVEIPFLGPRRAWGPLGAPSYGHRLGAFLVPLGAPGSSRIGPFSVSLVSLAWFPPYPFPWSDSRLIRFPGSRLILVRFSGPVPALSVSLVCFPPYPFPWFPLYPFPWSGSRLIRFSGLVPTLSVSRVCFPPYPFPWAGSRLIRFPGLTWPAFSNFYIPRA